MSDTETRSVAEIMGWRLGHEKRHTFDDDTWYFMPDGDTTRLGPPTPDDMLTWLDERGYDVRPPYDQPLTGRPVHLIVTATHRAPRQPRLAQFESDVDGPTLHAALEAAVRAVAEAER